MRIEIRVNKLNKEKINAVFKQLTEKWQNILIKVHFARYRVFLHDVTAAILVSQKSETVAMLVFQTNPLGVELFSYANASFCSNKFV